ncbi:MAG TPA: SDR family NAD(P)-dependent oxidoreductase [Hellea balneolensis]|uniref:SDR family NAD(P)-dependent oxidoreductase n=1 Tax=Hellea balneolensis TaxID=287478 RepID=A0A7C3CBX9_9PROT|nr:SDR family NAD(P)-dependent oxidoreductase [Hellea balneolensis]
MNSHTDLSGRTILVTGASRGIGFASARELSKAGAHIIATARTQGALEELDDIIRKEGGTDMTLVPMDLRAPDGIDQLGAAIYERWGHLDGLLANAGVLGEMAPVSHIAPKKFDEAIAVNITANYRLIRSLDSLLQASPSGRAVFISSHGAQSRKAYWGTYATTKSALDALVTCYAKETEKTNLRVNLLYPPAIRTQMRAKAMPGEDPDTLPTPSDIAPLIIPYLAPGYTGHGEIIDLRDKVKRR